MYSGINLSPGNSDYLASGNTYLGSWAGRSEATAQGNYNVGIGNFVMSAAHDGDHNVGVGASALGGVGDGNGNVGIGLEAGYNLKDTEDNVFIGRRTARSGTGTTIITGGNYNSIVGAYAAYDITTGYSNSMLGYKTGEDITEGNKNIFIGYQAGDTLTTGTDNVIIGYDADVSDEEGTNQIAIGSGVTAQADNTVKIGNAAITDVYLTGALTLTSGTATVSGGGFDAATTNMYVSKINGEIVTTIIVDIGGGSIVSSADEGDVIGESGAANAYITQLTSAVNGIVYKAEMACLELPTTGDANINLTANTSGTIAENANGEGGVVLINAGTHAVGKNIVSTSGDEFNEGLVNYYLYLTHGGTTAGTYGAGQFIIKLYGCATI
jgi:hypothetical protein